MGTTGRPVATGARRVGPSCPSSQVVGEVRVGVCEEELEEIVRTITAPAGLLLAGIVDDGSLAPLLDGERFGLDEVGAAHARLTGGGAVGKAVVEL